MKDDREGPSYERHRRAAPQRIGCRVVTVSDTRTASSDRSGPLLCRRLEEVGHEILDQRIVSDDEAPIGEAVLAAVADPRCEVLLLTGGTGIAPRDRSPDAVAALCDRVIPGFGELFRSLSWEEIGAAAMLSRAMAGVRGGTLIFVLPGSEAALVLALDRLILPELGHMVGELRRKA